MTAEKRPSKLEELKAKHAKELAEAQAEESIYAMLPEDIAKGPTISNLRAEPPATEPHGWLKFSSPSYDPENTWNPVAVLESLERAGWTAVPATLCKWDDYRRSAYPGLSESIPETKRGSFGHTDKLTDSEPIAPLWIEPQQYGRPEAKLFMRAPDGRLFRVLVDIPGVARLEGRRNEYRGGWSYERGSAKVRFPEEWHGHQYCTISTHTRAWVDTEQGISGAIYFTPHDEQEAWPLTASQFLASLLAK